ncbi:MULTISPECIES: ABC transporter permease [unclassified Gemella]|uniref:ABC transporter permease n=1 Tax=unclassified Gemella TaxID=2624949 RepID=UPI001074171C|nr:MULTISPECIES: ABC transporter permease [unclassified Gemella]MBF0710500.1 ABC transporter permease [Gemella sp. GL1.1]MBF0746559.1 ABC transporter permease [Gemella sp. 19428wG2_WT2a]NYS27844.1 ABC transporter permease [Gemella sp. GL1]TFU59919.1 ABC transporter permease [Gemella sp. WT2a]
MKKLLNIGRRHISIVLSILFILMWQGAANLKLLPKYIVPSPLEIINAFMRDWKFLIFHSQVTLLEAIIGLSSGLIVAIILALIMDSFKILNDAIYPILVVSQTIPTIAIAPILILWLGFGLLPKVILIVLTTAFPIVVAILDGFRNCDKDLLTLLKVMKASKWQILYHVKIPNSLPYFYAGLKVSVSYAFIAAVVAEWLGGFEGLGVYMIKAKKLFQYDTMFAIIILTSLISLLSIYLVTVSEKKFIKWKYLGDENEKI